MKLKHWIYSVVILTVTGCVSCSGALKPSTRGLLDEMSGNCKHGPQVQKAKPSGDANEEIKAEVEVECATPPAQILYGA
jgi:hypothetical protein